MFDWLQREIFRNVQYGEPEIETDNMVQLSTVNVKNNAVFKSISLSGRLNEFCTARSIFVLSLSDKEAFASRGILTRKGLTDQNNE